MKRIYIFTGKGGVGKSSIAAAHAVKSAEEGRKTLLVSTDMAHNLGDIFERKLGKDAVNVLPGLDVYEIDPEYVMENDFSAVMSYLASLLPETEGGGAQGIGMIPGMEELFSLLKIADIYHRADYERIIVDCAPTGETLSLLKFPELLAWYMEKFFPVGKVAVRMLTPISKAAFQVEMPNKNAMNEIERMFLKLVELQELLKDRAVTSVRIVTTPEKMVVEETKRSYMYLNLYNFNVDGIYINRILPTDLDNDFFAQWIAIQKEYTACIRESFAALPVCEIPWYDEELKGERAIQRIVDEVLFDKEVFAVQNITERECFEKTEDGYQLKVFLPYAEKEAVDLYQAATDLVIRTGNFKRSIPLPNVLRSCTVTGARFEEGVLRIQFGEGSDSDE